MAGEADADALGDDVHAHPSRKCEGVQRRLKGPLGGVDLAARAPQPAVHHGAQRAADPWVRRPLLGAGQPGARGGELVAVRGRPGGSRGRRGRPVRLGEPVLVGEALVVGGQLRRASQPSGQRLEQRQVGHAAGTQPR